MSHPHPFDQAIALTPTGPHQYSGATSPPYGNMVGPFGGVTAAVVMQSVMQHVQRLGEPISLTVNYAAALADGAFALTARPVRTNRSTQHWVMEITQPDANGEPTTVITATAVTAARRETWGVDDEPMPPVPAPADVPRARLEARVEWVSRYAMHPITGALPTVWEGQGDGSLMQMWVRDDPLRALDFCSLTALADVFYPRVWLRRARPVPTGTVSMTVYFHAGSRELEATGSGWLLAQARAQAFRNGFFDQTAQLWNEAGVLLATTHQIVYYKE
ncbi:MAG: acyl-CoA thioesterase [Hydrogenophaga sp.]|jgi:acyl-CoA thioesterase|uniref:acyl-CoA thioesterase n=1 Tax=Hydrogenophaga sp. TaxID=1904254 RepID=UPI001D5E6EF9|nr:thioesterase family protein [Hydrogenophaga sp.]MBW0169596.1 thioesterase family protein [Hydrogenophaga sp.]MBW0183411.1 thioesterase family protein [Hydrogenophaga sp.]